jgi:hypothetical protein
MSDKDELPIPDAARRDKNSREMIRAWIAERKLQCVVNIGTWATSPIDEYRAWGILLADVARHVSKALEEEDGRDPRETVLAIRDEFLGELDRPTSSHEGGFAQKKNKKQT